MRLDTPRPAPRPRWWLHLAVVVGVLGALGLAPAGDTAGGSGWSPFASFFDPLTFSLAERVGLFLALAVSVFALVYAWVLGKKVSEADRGTQGMQAIAQAVVGVGRGGWVGGEVITEVGLEV